MEVSNEGRGFKKEVAELFELLKQLAVALKLYIGMVLAVFAFMRMKNNGQFRALSRIK